MKRLFLIVLIVLSVVVTWYLKRQVEPVSAQVRATIEMELAKDARFPARPVWWQDGAILAVGMLADGAPKDAAALDVCALLLSQGVTETSVEVYDLDKIRQSEDWNLIGKASCKP